MRNIHIITFKINDNLYGIEIKYLLESGRISNFFKIPTKVEYFEGLFNLRGTIIPVINLGKRLGINYEIEPDKQKNFLYVNDTVYSFIIVVDEISGVKNYKYDFINSSGDLIIDTIIDKDNLISLIDVKQIIVLDDFKFTKRFLFKSSFGIEEFEIDKIEKEETKIPFAVFKINNQLFAINAIFIKQLIEPDNKNFKLFSLKELVAGEIEFNKKIIEVINFPELLEMELKEGYYIALIEKDEKLMAIIIPEKTEFVEITTENILDDVSYFKNLFFIDKIFKFNNENVKIINIDRLFEYLTSRKALEW